MHFLAIFVLVHHAGIEAMTAAEVGFSIVLIFPTIHQ
jgi:hypothetical protein